MNSSSPKKDVFAQFTDIRSSNISDCGSAAEAADVDAVIVNKYTPPILAKLGYVGTMPFFVHMLNDANHIAICRETGSPGNNCGLI